MSIVDDQAAEIRKVAADLGLSVSSRNSVVIVKGSFEPGDVAAYLKMESDAYTVLRMFRQVRPGSIWGTDSQSVGGQIGLEKGYVEMKKSGVAVRLAAKFA